MDNIVLTKLWSDDDFYEVQTILIVKLLRI